MPEENRRLRPQEIIEAIDTLENRVRERFGERGLTRTCEDLLNLARYTAKRVASLSRPYWFLRFLASLVIAGGLYGLSRVVTIYGLDPGRELPGTGPLGLAQGLEALVNLLILSGAALIFIINLERRLKRSRALSGLHQLRSVAHVIDMHQLTKDPQSMRLLAPTRSSPKNDLSGPQLMRYFDYCTEMLALIAKLAALYGASMRDSAVIQAVNDVETLTAALSNKIYQKIVMIQRDMARPAGSLSPAAEREPAPVK